MPRKGDVLKSATRCGQRCYFAVPAESTCRSTSAAVRRLRSAGSADTGGGRSPRATCSISAMEGFRTAAPSPVPFRPSGTAGRSPFLWAARRARLLHGQDIEEFFRAEWEVHYNSSRTGVRLVGPRPKWARPDGGEAGLHPSNLHDNAYAVGTIDFTGDMPVILGKDGPSLGGFVCPATIITADLWKVGQLRSGDKVKFIPVTPAQAAAPRGARGDSGAPGPADHGSEPVGTFRVAGSGGVSS